MFIKFQDDSPKFEQSVQVLKRKYNTTASATAVKFGILDLTTKAIENEMLQDVIELKDSRIKHLEEVIESLLGYKKGYR